MTRLHRLAKVTYLVAGTAVLGVGLVALRAVLGHTRPATHDTQPPVPYAVVYPPRGVAPLRVRLDGSGSTDNVGVTAWHWDFDDGTTGEGVIVDHVFASAGTYHPKLVVEDAAGTFRDVSQTVDVGGPAHDRHAPVARLIASRRSGTLPLVVSFDASASTDDTGVTRTRWDFGDGAVSEGIRREHRFVTAGRFVVQLTVWDAAGHHSTATTDVTATATPPSSKPVAGILPTPALISAPADVKFEATKLRDDTVPIAWQWDFGDGTTSEGRSVVHRYTHQGRYVAALTVRDASGQFAQAARDLIVAEPVTVTEKILFDDAWNEGIADDPVGVVTALSENAHHGRRALVVNPQRNGSLTIHTKPERYDAYDRLGFWVNSDEPDAIAVRALLPTGPGPLVPIEPYLLAGAGGLMRDVWRRAAIPLSALGAEHSPVAGFVWEAADRADLPDFALDDVSMLPPDEDLPVLSECAVPPPIRDFVERQNGGLVTEGLPFRAVGANLYYAQQELSRHVQTGEVRPLAHVRAAMTAAVCAGANVIRILGFNDSPPDTEDDAVIQTAPGVLREEGLRGLDLAIAEAASHHLRVILTLTNNWSAFGGIPRYAQWAHDAPADAMDDPQVLDWVVSYSEALSERINTFTGTRYRDDPTILAVELANELRCRDCQAGHDATAFATALAKAVAAAWPNHLIADGGEGFDDGTAPYAGLEGTTVVKGDEGTSFRALAAAPEIDLVSYHLYPESWGLSREQALDYIADHELIAHQEGKIAYMGEFGLQTQDDDRAAIYDEWLQRLFTQDGGSLALVWQLTYPGRPDNDGFALVPGTSGQALAALARAAHLLSAPDLDGVSVALLYGAGQRDTSLR